MSLATRCPSCGTIFRVVQDQLRVSQGWVRCGRCTEAFNALESMVDLPPPRAPGAMPPTADDPPAAPAPAQPPAVIDDAATTPAPAMPAPDTATIDLPPGASFIASDGAIEPTADVPGTEALETAAAAAPGAPTDAGTPVGEALAIDGPGTAAPEGSDAALAFVPARTDDRPSTAAHTPITADDGEGSAAAPSFIVQAERAARWRRPGVRAALAAGVLLSALTLTAQATYTFRDRVAASLPALRPLLVQACSLLDCRVGDVRQIDALSVETSALVRVDGTSVYRLAVTLRNRASIDIAAPALDLALTDPQGRPIARRVLQMADLDLPLRVLKAGTELPIQVPLGIGDRQVSGYTVEIFYP